MWFLKAGKHLQEVAVSLLLILNPGQLHFNPPAQALQSRNPHLV